MRFAAVTLCTITLLTLATPARTADTPPFAQIVESFRAQLAVDSDLARENARLRRKLKREHRANNYHARLVRKLRAANRERLELGATGLTAGFLCIHHFEGAWDSATGNGYYGGLQMDSSFMRSYGGNFLGAWGTANNWPPYIQIAVGVNAYLSGRGFHPWPNTARSCGLL